MLRHPDVTKGGFCMPITPHRRLLALVLMLIMTRCEAAPENDCNLTMVTQVPLQVQDHLLVVPAGINGKWVRLVADSGSERTMLSSAVAEQLGLPHDPRYTRRSMGIGGVTTTTDVAVDRLVLGGVRFPIERIAVGDLTLRNARGLNADGLLGADLLLAYDLDIDVPGGQLTLYRARICPGIQPPWREPWMEITGIGARKDRLLLPFELDSVAGLGILDTGAQANVVGVAMARRLGLTEPVLAADPAVQQTGIGPAITISHLHRFKLLRIGPVAEEAPLITVLPADLGVGDALIGETFLRGRRVWLSFRNRQVFVSRRPNER
jgi:predicted aspartyl protease